MPTMRENNKEMQRKFREFDAELKALKQENVSLKELKTENQELEKVKQTYADSCAKVESLTSQLKTFTGRFNQQLEQTEATQAQIDSYKEQIAAYERKVEVLADQKSEAESTAELKSRDIEDLKRSNNGFEKENSTLVRERAHNFEQINELTRCKRRLEQEL